MGGGFQQQVAWSGYTTSHVSTQKHRASVGPNPGLFLEGWSAGRDRHRDPASA